MMSTSTSKDLRLDIFTCWCFQASKLAEYKPIIDVQSLPETLQEVEDTSTAAQLYFKSIRMKVVYYEDLIMNPKVGILPFAFMACFSHQHVSSFQCYDFHVSKLLPN